MRTLLSERYAPITSSIGFLEAPLDDTARTLEEWRRSLYPRVEVSYPPEGFPEVLHRLEPLKGGTPQRELLVSAGRWTAYFDNGLRGPDAVTKASVLADKLQCRGLAIKSTPHTVDLPGIKEGRMGAVQFEMFGPVGTYFLNYVRTLSVAFDDRWRFDANGTVQPFEEVEAYGSRRVRDRFTSEMLERYCQALGIDVFNPGYYGRGSVFMESEVPTAPGAVGGAVMTLREVQAWLEIVPGMAEGLPG